MAWPLWFIFSMAIVLAIFSVLHRLMRWEYAAWALFLFAMAVRLFPYAGHRLFSLEENATVFWDYYAFLTSRTLGGGVYIAGGMLLQMFQRRLASVFVALLALVASFAIFRFIPGFFMAPFFGGMAMLILALVIGKYLSERPVFLRLRAYSMWIYYLHMIPLALAYLLWPSAFRGLDIWAAFAAFSLVSVALAVALTRLQAGSRFAWLKVLVS